MCWLCDHPTATIDDYLDVLRAKIDERGWAVQYVEDERRPFAYTIGLHERGLSEVMITGVTPGRALLVLNTVASYCVKTAQPRPGETMSLPDCLAVFVRVTRPEVYLAHAFNIYGPKVRALQIVWNDPQGHSPWCPDFNDGRGGQPVLGIRPLPGPGGRGSGEALATAPTLVA